MATEKKLKTIIVACVLPLLLVACGESGYPMTEFYVKNTSDKIISFEASVIKPPDYYEVSLPFTVYPNDSVLARKIGFAKDGKNPQKWFNKFVIHPVEGIPMNDPKLSENWIKCNTNSIPTYVFTLNIK
jgi:hypothetical protein